MPICEIFRDSLVLLDYDNYILVCQFPSRPGGIIIVNLIWTNGLMDTREFELDPEESTEVVIFLCC
jgi:hypothetical protein